MGYPTLTWRAARRDYEVNGMTPSELCTKYGMSTSTISNRAFTNGWVRKSKDISTDLIRAEIIEKLRESGAIDDIPKKLQQALNAIDKIDQTTPDYKTINDAIKEILKIVGAYAPVKTEVDLKQQVIVIIGKIQTIIVDYVPVDKRNECIDKLTEVLK